uniref:ARAD1B05522p n=1 Tax=Blastobotrys adeninivorans TaxID=409370 RepID=A0A060T4S3_BLAAD
MAFDPFGKNIWATPEPRYTAPLAFSHQIEGRYRTFRERWGERLLTKKLTGLLNVCHSSLGSQYSQYSLLHTAQLVPPRSAILVRLNQFRPHNRSPYDRFRCTMFRHTHGLAPLVPAASQGQSTFSVLPTLAVLLMSGGPRG